MSLFIESKVRERGRMEVQRAGHVKKAERLIVEAMESYSESKTYDIFLSHSVRDAELILGMKGTFEDLGYSVYVDWIEDPQLDRTKVTPATAEKLRKRMESSRSLFYVTTQNAISSKWMPWECGFFDGKKEKVAIVPVVAQSADNSYSGQEYLGLYPYIVQQKDTAGVEKLWVRLSSKQYVGYKKWVSTPSQQLSWSQG